MDFICVPPVLAHACGERSVFPKRSLAGQFMQFDSAQSFPPGIDLRCIRSGLDSRLRAARFLLVLPVAKSCTVCIVSGFFIPLQNCSVSCAGAHLPTGTALYTMRPRFTRFFLFLPQNIWLAGNGQIRQAAVEKYTGPGLKAQEFLSQYPIESANPQSNRISSPALAASFFLPFPAAESPSLRLPKYFFSPLDKCTWQE